jgi:predicted  nucleic acid-binding Zn-ribbon protein
VTLEEKLAGIQALLASDEEASAAVAERNRVTELEARVNKLENQLTLLNGVMSDRDDRLRRIAREATALEVEAINWECEVEGALGRMDLSALHLELELPDETELVFRTVERVKKAIIEALS